MKLGHFARSTVARALRWLRRGQPVVLWPTPGLGFGNLLYFWMQADKRRRAGEQAWVLATPKGEPWRDDFPEIFSDFAIQKGQIPFRYRRELGSYQEFGKHYNEDDLSSFIRRYVLDAPGLLRFQEEVSRFLGDSTIVANIRRGDYYSVPEFQERYGFDVRGFVLEAVRRELESNVADRVHVISDDITWCRAALEAPLAKLGIVVTFAEGGDPMRDFATLAWSDRTILANSTFSYWGGYVAVVRNPEAHVVAPWFHGRAWNDGKSFHLHPKWDVVEGFHDVKDSVLDD